MAPTTRVFVLRPAPNSEPPWAAPPTCVPPRPTATRHSRRLQRSKIDFSSSSDALSLGHSPKEIIRRRPLALFFCARFPPPASRCGHCPPVARVLQLASRSAALYCHNDVTSSITEPIQTMISPISIEGAPTIPITFERAMSQLTT